MLEMREMIANTGAATDNDITDDATGAGRGMRRQAAQTERNAVSPVVEIINETLSVSVIGVEHRPVSISRIRVTSVIDENKMHRHAYSM